MNVLHLETQIPCLCVLGGGEWVGTRRHIRTWVCMYVEARGWRQLCSSIHFYCIFLHLGVSLNQLNRIDRKPRDPPVSVSPVLGQQMYHCPWVFTRILRPELRLPRLYISQLMEVISTGTDMCFLVVLIAREILLIIFQRSPICWNVFSMSPLVGGRISQPMSETHITMCCFCPSQMSMCALEICLNALRTPLSNYLKVIGPLGCVENRVWVQLTSSHMLIWHGYLQALISPLTKTALCISFFLWVRQYSRNTCLPYGWSSVMCGVHALETWPMKHLGAFSLVFPQGT